MKNPAGRDVTLDEAVAAVRDEEPPAAAVDAAGARVWQRVAGQAAAAAPIRGCEDVLALLPAYHLRTLPPARVLLVEDHLRECAACRAALGQPGTRRLAVLPWRAAPAVKEARAARSFRAYAAAAAVLLAAGAGAFWTHGTFFAVPQGVRAAVQSASGVLQLVAQGRVDGLVPGREVGEGETVRTGRESGAVLRLTDGSLVEMSERAELSVRARGQDTTIHLERGRIIVQAAKRRSGFLRVASRDCNVKVTGTVFSVNGGLKGSRVSVLEGHVRVDHGGQETALQPGEQWTSSADVGAVPLREELGWSRDVDRHLALLGELRTLRAQWDAVPKPGVRHESRLLARLPASTTVFAAVPNYGEALSEARRLFAERMQQSAVLREWWQDVHHAQRDGRALERVVETVRGFTSYLGDELALAVVDKAGTQHHGPVFVAAIAKPGLREFIDEKLAEAARLDGRRPQVRVVDDAGLASLAPAAPGELVVLVGSELLVASTDAGLVRSIGAARVDAGLATTAFGQRIAAAYAEGVDLLFTADVQRLASGRPRLRDGSDEERWQRSGIAGLRYLVVDHARVAEHGQTRASLVFDGPRRGIASWLGAPAPMGTLEFFSPNAQAAAAFVIKDPALLLEDVLSLADTHGPQARRELALVESKLDLRLREDLAQTLGGEVALALDGPLLPTPAWKLAIEVYDPGRLQTSIAMLVRKASEAATREGREGPRLEAEDVGGRTFYSLRGPGGLAPLALHYTFADGYLVAAGSRAFVVQALRVHDSGDSLARSASFRALFPADGRANVSGLVYQNLGPLMSTLLDAAPAELKSGQRRAFEALAGSSKPSLLCAFGGEDQIQVASVGGGLGDLDPTQLALPLLLPRVLSGTHVRPTP